MTLFTGSLQAALVGASFDEAEHLTHGQPIGLAGEEIASIRATPGLNEAALFQAGKYQLQELLRDGLAARNIGNADGLTRCLASQVEHRPQRVFAFD